MDGPERLEDDARPTRRAAWLVLGVAVLVVGGLGAVRVAGVLPDPPSPSRSPSAAGRAAVGWPRGAGSGTLFVLDEAGVAVVDVSSGLVRRGPVTVDPGQVALTPGGAGVVVWFESGRGTPRIVTAGLPTAPTLGPVVAQGRDFLAGPQERLWLTRDASRGLDGPSTWRLVGVDDVVVAVHRLSGRVQGDGAGGLFAVDDADVHHVDPTGAESSWVGSVGAVGPDGYEAMRCAGRRCTSFLHEVATGVDTPIHAPTSSDEGVPVLSPGNRWSASVQPTSSDDPDVDPPAVVRVEAAGGGRELRSFPATEDREPSLAWLSDRWLAATGPDGLVLYDTVDDRLVSPGIGLTEPRQLVFRSS